MTTVTKTVTGNGIGIFRFEDRDGADCVLQDSLSSEPAIRFGIVGKTMHLNQQTVRQLLPYLKQFAETGDYIFYANDEDSE